jgi:hypothetical protein
MISALSPRADGVKRSADAGPWLLQRVIWMPGREVFRSVQPAAGDDHELGIDDVQQERDDRGSSPRVRAAPRAQRVCTLARLMGNGWQVPGEVGPCDDRR